MTRKRRFSVGDTIRCINANGASNLTAGKEYTVTETNSGREQLVKIEEMPGHIFHAWRFTYVKS